MTQSNSDPKQAIIDYISQPPGETVLPPPSIEQRTALQPVTRKGGGLGAKVSTIQFLQERIISTRQLHFVTFENETDEQEYWLWCVREFAPGQWRTAGGANLHPGEKITRDHPWVNLAAGWSRDVFWAGGTVHDNGLSVVRVRLSSENGIVLEDRVRDGLVMFVLDQWVERPLQVELYNREESLVGVHQALKLHELEMRHRNS